MGWSRATAVGAAGPLPCSGGNLHIAPLHRTALYCTALNYGAGDLTAQPHRPGVAGTCTSKTPPGEWSTSEPSPKAPVTTPITSLIPMVPSLVSKKPVLPGAVPQYCCRIEPRFPFTRTQFYNVQNVMIILVHNVSWHSCRE